MRAAAAAEKAAREAEIAAQIAAGTYVPPPPPTAEEEAAAALARGEVCITEHTCPLLYLTRYRIPHWRLTCRPYFRCRVSDPRFVMSTVPRGHRGVPAPGPHPRDERERGGGVRGIAAPGAPSSPHCIALLVAPPPSVPYLPLMPFSVVFTPLSLTLIVSCLSVCDIYMYVLYRLGMTSGGRRGWTWAPWLAATGPSRCALFTCMYRWLPRPVHSHVHVP